MSSKAVTSMEPHGPRSLSRVSGQAKSEVGQGRVGTGSIYVLCLVALKGSPPVPFQALPCNTVSSIRQVAEVSGCATLAIETASCAALTAIADSNGKVAFRQ